MMARRVGIVYPWSNLDSNPTIVGTITRLTEAGYLIDIFTVSSPAFEDPVFGENVTILFVENSRLGRVLLVSRIFLRHLRRRYACVIGVDARGLLLAHRITRLIRSPVVYCSFELLLSNELTTQKQLELKRGERQLSRAASFVIIQDQTRADLLARDNGIAPERFVLLPNAPLGEASRNPSRYWHERFRLPPESRVVLHSGSVAPWTGIDDIVESVPRWPEEWVLVVHTRFRPDSDFGDALTAKASMTERVLLSLEPVPRSEYRSLADGADIGIAFYIPLPGKHYSKQNLEYVGLSSGKVASYLQSGLPIIVNSSSNLGRIVSREGCGLSADSSEDIHRRIDEIARRYDDFSARACQTFQTLFNFEERFKEVADRIDQL